MSVIIDDLEFKKIVTSAGIPTAELEDLEVSEDDIKNLFIGEALEEYFKWFPIIREQSSIISSGSEFVFKFPSDDIYGINDLQLKSNSGQGGKTSSVFANELSYRRVRSKGLYGIQTSQIFHLEKANRMSQISIRKGLKRQIDFQGRTLSVRSSNPGELIISWSAKSEDFGAVPFKHKTDVRDLSRAILLEYLVNVRSQISSVSENEFDTSNMETRASDLREKVETKWREFTIVTIVQ